MRGQQARTDQQRLRGTDGPRTIDSVLASYWALLNSESSAGTHFGAVCGALRTNENGPPQVAGEPRIYAENTAIELKEAPVRVELTLADLQSFEHV